jgi:hypothetical protein
MINLTIIHHNLASGELVREGAAWVELWCLGKEVSVEHKSTRELTTSFLKKEINLSLLTAPSKISSAMTPLQSRAGRIEYF